MYSIVLAGLVQLTMDRLKAKGTAAGVSFSDVAKAMGEACEEMKVTLRKHGFKVDSDHQSLER